MEFIYLFGKSLKRRKVHNVEISLTSKKQRNNTREDIQNVHETTKLQINQNIFTSTQHQINYKS